MTFLPPIKRRSLEKGDGQMHSIRTKITLLTVSAIVVVMVTATLLSAVSISSLGKNTSDQLLYLMCRTGEKNLDDSFESVEQSVETMAGYAEDDLAATAWDQMNAHLDRVRDVFEKTANNTSGILTYYYRMDPSVVQDAKGFWYVYTGRNGFAEHEVTDISLYDTNDQSALVWFTVPKATGRSIWLPPYVTENLGAYVLSYNVPIYKDGIFIGVIGIEVDYNTIVEQVNNISLYGNGYAFINDENGKLIYHPNIDVSKLSGKEHPSIPDGLLSDSRYITYTYDGIKKQAVWLPLDNGMRLNVTVPVSEINGRWHSVINMIIGASLILLVIFIFISIRFADRIARPLRKLTRAAEQVGNGNYDVELDCSGSDEVGILTRTFSKLIDNLKVYISDLNSLAYADALTSVHNKGAFSIYIRNLNEHIKESGGNTEFAICVFDCNDLKRINDEFGHDKGDVYLKNACSLICRVFEHSPVYRTGGDEFAAVLMKDDYRSRGALIRLFKEWSGEITASAKNRWEQISVAAGMAEYDPKTDSTAENVIQRADKLMYEDKKKQKENK